MSLPSNHIFGALVLPMLLLLLSSCATYNTQISSYYSHVGNNDYAKANSVLESNKLLQAKRNRLLYLLEKGKMAHLLKHYEESNNYFNEADVFIEDVRTSASDVVLGTLLNPMMQKYKGEDFEKFMVHYYKAMNYMYLGQTAEAIVEAKRISLRTYAQQDKAGNSKKYSDDAFALILQGLIYESASDINNAFISYRNAANIFLENDGAYYGVSMPLQLKKDLLRTAYALGFTSDLEYFERKFSLTYEPAENVPGGELVLFWENGLAPVKREQNLFFSLTKDGAGNFMFVDPTGSINIPFDFSLAVDRDKLSATDLRTFRVAFPRYEEQPLFFKNAIISKDSTQYRFEAAESVNTLAFATLKERFVKEASIALSRLVVKKLAEEAAKPDKDDKNKDEKQAMAIALQIFNFASEKADTRNWQTLPHTIYYSRIPLEKGENNVTVKLEGSGSQELQLKFVGNGRLQFQNLCTLR